MQKLINNYEKRINAFVLKMAEKPIIVKKERDKYLTTREELYAKTSNKILDKKGFVFTSYKTDKERIGDFLKTKKIIDDYLSSYPKKKIKKPEATLIQPSMRFKARTDLERIYDSIQNHESIFKEKKLVQDQLLKMGFVSQNVDDYDDSDSNIENNKKKFDEINGILDEEERKKKILHNKILKERKNMIEKRKSLLSIEKKKNSIDNNQVKHLREELHQKVHFKAMENLSLFKTSTIDHNIFKTWSQKDLMNQKNLRNNKNIYYANITNGFINNPIIKKNQTSRNNELTHYEENNKNGVLTSYRENKYNNLINNKIILNDLNITKDIVKSNPLLYNMNFTQAKNLNKDNHLSEDKIQTLKKLAFKNENYDNSDENDSDKNDLNFGKIDAYDDLKKEENVVLDGEQFKKNETYKIADKLLKTCNWNEKKVKYDGSFGKGKLMFTNGLTLKEFEEKYGLLP